MKNHIKLISFLIMIIGMGSMGCNPSAVEETPPEPPSSQIIITGGTQPHVDVNAIEHPGPEPEAGLRPGIIIEPLHGTAGEGASLNVYPLEVDPDQDGVLNVAFTGHPEVAIDNCPGVFNPDQADADHNGVGDACEAR